MKLWSFQPASILEDLERDGVYHCDGSKSVFISDDTWGFREPYEWLIGKMIERVSPPPEGVKYPIWGWVKNCSSVSGGKPDLRKHKYYDNTYVLLELEVEEERLLLSNFDEWHHVLNNMLCREEEFWENLSEDEWDAIMEKRPPYGQDEVTKSWDGIFNDKSCCVQATFWEIRDSDIVKVHKINRRPKNDR